MKVILLILIGVAIAAAVDWPKMDSPDVGGGGDGGPWMQCRFTYMKCWFDAKEITEKYKCQLDFNKCMRGPRPTMPANDALAYDDGDGSQAGGPWMQCRFTYMKCWFDAKNIAEKYQCQLDFNKCMRGPRPTMPANDDVVMGTSNDDDDDDDDDDNGSGQPGGPWMQCRFKFMKCWFDAKSFKEKYQCQLDFNKCMRGPRPHLPSA
ncbi:uncharacterized protein LOC116614950 [Nematostella vectensis]|uniref:uncharacterized protein LOC116614950 n=1 Tax=Nematostella vectensis TaxID=45351 RepID=UPI002076E458|nr:uncharacterized protein LOC116614950 [Nematostella vectensis]